MLIQYSYPSKKIKDQIDQSVGKSFGLLSILKMGGIGSQRFTIDEANEEILDLFSYQSGECFTNIELRPKGIVLRFRARIDTYVLVLPYWSLSIYKSNGLLTLHGGKWKLKLLPSNNLALNRSFLTKMLDQKSRLINQTDFQA